MDNHLLTRSNYMEELSGMTISINEAIELGVELVEMDQNLLLVGQPGVGKTDAATIIGQRTNRKLFIEHPAVSAPEDYKGFAMWADGDADFHPLGQMKDILNHKEPLIWFLDDLGQAPLAVQNGLMQFVHARGRAMGRHVLPPHTAVIAATNRRKDNAGVMGLTEPIKNRFTTIVHVDADLEGWTQWALSNKIDPMIIAYLHYRPENLSKFEPNKDFSQSPTPRGWENVNKLLKVKTDSPRLKLEMITGAVGAAVAQEYSQFELVLKDLPDLDDIEAGHAAKSELNNNQAYAVCGALSVRGLTDAKLINVTKFVEGLQMEFQVLWSELWYKTNKEQTDRATTQPLVEGKAWGSWIQNHADSISLS